MWSNTTGYPTDNVYREFYRDIGYDLSMNYIRPYIHEPEVRVFTGYKYWAITGDTDQKVPYVPRSLANAPRNMRGTSTMLSTTGTIASALRWEEHSRCSSSALTPSSSATGSMKESIGWKR